MTTAMYLDDPGDSDLVNDDPGYRSQQDLPFMVNFKEEELDLDKADVSDHWGKEYQ
jgi:hypothetical protein